MRWFPLVLILCLMASPTPAEELLNMLPAMLAGAGKADYNNGTWPVLRHDQHNADFVSQDFGSMTGLSEFQQIAWVLGSNATDATGVLGTDHPASVMSSTVVFNYQGKKYCASTAGKVDYPNLHVFDPEDGSEVWRAAANTAALDPGPGSCAIASSVLADDRGRLFVSDCSYIYCYSMRGQLNANGDMKPLWKRAMPYLYQFNTGNKLWYPVDDPALERTRAKPFVTMFLTRPDWRKVYLGGIATDGGIGVYDPNNGDLFELGHLANPQPSGGQDWNTEAYCYPQAYADADDPMCYAQDGSNANCPGDDMSPYGIWCTGAQPQTDGYDQDYFMHPCQLEAFLSGNTVSSGTLVVNTPAVVKDPDRPQVSQLFINGAQSEFLEAYDLNQTQDAMLYRIDFDPTAASGQRLEVRNYQLGADSKPIFKGRMVDGDNSGSSPAVSANEKWLFTADNNGEFYCFSTEDGAKMWQATVGSVLGSATVAQRTEADGRFYVYSMGDSKMWIFGVNPDTGAKEYEHSIDFRDYLKANYWRSGAAYTATPSGWERHATASSSISGANDLLILSYTMGWTQSTPLGLVDVLDVFMAPTHTVFLFVDRLAAHDSNNGPADVIQAGIIDIYGTVEMGIVFTPWGDGLRGFLPYGSQATSLARYMDLNDMMNENMKSLYVKPYGGVRYVQADPVQ